MARLAQAVQAGAIEVVNGTYGQPLSLTVSGEAMVRHFYYGLRAIEEAMGARVESFLSQEPLFFPQMPQVLAGFGFQRAVLRTHWAPFGSDPGVDATVVRWRGPDGSEMPTVPRYAFTDYGWLRPDHRGLEKGGLTGADLARWGRDQLDGLRRRAEMHGVDRPLLSRVADFHMVDPARPDAPLANARALASQGARFLTVREYFQEGGDDRSADLGPRSRGLHLGHRRHAGHHPLGPRRRAAPAGADGGGGRPAGRRAAGRHRRRAGRGQPGGQAGRRLEGPAPRPAPRPPRLRALALAPARQVDG